MKAAGTTFKAGNKTLMAMASTQKVGCTGCHYENKKGGCNDTSGDPFICFDPTKGEYVTFKEVKK